jgi:transposase
VRRYGEAVKADIMKRMKPPARQSAARMSEETGIHIATLYAWRKGWRLEGEVVPASLDANEKPVLPLREQRELEKLPVQDQREIKRLQRELHKKEKALAEAADRRRSMEILDGGAGGGAHGHQPAHSAALETSARG